MTKPRSVALRRYLMVIALGNLLWESAHFRLYSIWLDGTWSQIVFALIHCTVGDVMIGATTLLGALLILRQKDWPDAGFARIALVTIALALAYTVFSEWLNIEVRQTWAYRDIMPTLPMIGTGLSPLAQWVAVPLLAFWFVRSAPS